MNFNQLIHSIQSYIQANLAGAIAAAVILLFLLYKKPKFFFILIIIAFAAIGVMNLFAKLSATGLGK